VLARFGIELFNLHLFRMKTFVLGCRVKVTGTRGGNQSYLIAHLLAPENSAVPGLKLFAFGPQVGNDFLDALFIDNSQPFG
jgi:hypothetical protein